MKRDVALGNECQGELLELPDANPSGMNSILPFLLGCIKLGPVADFSSRR